RKQKMVGVTRIDQRHHDWHDLIVVWTALAVKADERPTPADCAVHFSIRVNKISEVTDDDVLRVDAHVLEDVELLEGRLPRNAGVGEDRNVRREVCAAHGPKYLALILGDVVPRPDLTERTYGIGLRLLDERPKDLLLAHGADLPGVEGLGVEA